MSTFVSVVSACTFSVSHIVLQDWSDIALIVEHLILSRSLVAFSLLSGYLEQVDTASHMSPFLIPRLLTGVFHRALESGTSRSFVSM